MTTRTYQNLMNLGREMTASREGKYSGSIVRGVAPSGNVESVAMVPHTDSRSGLLRQLAEERCDGKS